MEEKERENGEEVNIDINTGDAAEGTCVPEKIPFHILLCSDLNPQFEVESWEGDWRIRSVDKYSFAALIEEMAPRLEIDVPNRIGRQTQDLELELSFPDIKAFRPERVIEQVPVMKRMAEIRALVRRARGGEVDRPNFRRQLDALGIDGVLAEQLHQVLQAPEDTAKTPPAANREDRLDSLLSMVDVGGEEEEIGEVEGGGDPAQRLLDLLLDAALPEAEAPVLSQPQKSAAERLIGELDGMLNRQLDAIMHHPQFLQLEAAWRGLKFLVDRIDFKKDIRLSVLPVGKEDLDEALYHQVLNPSFAGTVQQLVEAPFSLIVADFEFESTTVDLNDLDELGQTMLSLQVPLLAGVGARFFGLETPSDLGRLPVLPQLTRQDRYILWNKLRATPQGNFVGLTLPGLLLRHPYRGGGMEKEFTFAESVEEERQHAWGTGGLGVAVAVAASFAAHGWPTRISGPGSTGPIGDLPLWEYSIGGMKARIPLQAIVSDAKQRELYEAGFVCLGCRTNEDAASITYAPTAFRPPQFEDPEHTRAARQLATLSCQLFSAYLGHFLLRFQRELGAGLPADRLREEVCQRLRGVLAIGGEGIAEDAVEVEVGDHPEKQSCYQLMVHLKVPAHILESQIGLGMGMEVPH